MIFFENTKDKATSETVSSRINKNALGAIKIIAFYEDRTLSKVLGRLIERGLKDYLKENPEMKEKLLNADGFQNKEKIKAYITLLE